ncbi:MAG: cell division protein FtsL [Pseudomonadota bacterium]
MSGRPGGMLFLLALVIVSAIAVVHAKHEGRKLFIELQALGKERDNMDIEWGQLQLEQGTLTTQGKIEKVARERLGMASLDAAAMVIVKP